MPQPSCVECHEDRSLDQYCSYSTLLLVCVESTATSTTTGSLESWHRLRHVNNLSPHLGISIRLRNVHADRPTCPGPRPAASPYYANCATTTSTSQAVLMSLVVSLVFSRLTMAARRSPVYLANSSTDYSLWWTPLHDLFALRGSTSTSPRYSVTFTGYGCQSG